jgi:chromosome segregation ATPase
MPTIEERLQALEQEHQTLEREHTELKKTIELQTIAIRALVSKEAFEKLQATVEEMQEQNGKLFDTLIAHDHLTNERLEDIQNQIIEQDNKLDGKIVGLQTEVRQTQKQIDTRFEKVETLLTQILARLPEQ